MGLIVSGALMVAGLLGMIWAAVAMYWRQEGINRAILKVIEGQQKLLDQLLKESENVQHPSDSGVCSRAR